MNELSVSVIIPTYNRASMLARAIDSVLRQTIPALEVIVIDDGSSDQTTALMVSKYKPVNYITSTHAGVSRARNIGIERATGDWIALLDSDDEWAANKLQSQIQALQQNPSYQLCHTDENWIRHGKHVNPMLKHQKRGGQIYKHCLPICAISPSTVLIHRSVFDSVGLFDTNLPACEDYDLWLRICASYPVLFLDKKLVTRYAGHNDQLSAQHWGMDRFRVTALLKMLNGNSLNAENKQLTIDMLQKKCRVLIKGGQKRGNTVLVQHYQNIFEMFSPQQAINKQTVNNV